MPPSRVAALNRGEAESSNLAEILAIDIPALLTVVVPDISSIELERLREAEGIVRKMLLAGETLLERSGPRAINKFMAHPSDVVRSWAAYMIAAEESWTLEERLARLRPLADDAHSGVREWAWLALRPRLAAELPAAISLLKPWTKERSAYLRRFTTESTRPRGVWCMHLEALKERPERGEPLLEPLRADPEKYVQDSVSNWLNDASKTRADWVRELCRRWLAESESPATQRICRRALRTVGVED